MSLTWRAIVPQGWGIVGLISRMTLLASWIHGWVKNWEWSGYLCPWMHAVNAELEQVRPCQGEPGVNSPSKLMGLVGTYCKDQHRLAWIPIPVQYGKCWFGDGLVDQHSHGVFLVKHVNHGLGPITSHIQNDVILNSAVLEAFCRQMSTGIEDLKMYDWSLDIK